jgi:hypothetical protein
MVERAKGRKMIKMPKPVPMVLMVATLAWMLPQTAQADQKDCPKGDVEKSGTFQANIKTVGFIVGVRWGEGTLTLNDGSQHKIHLEGAKLLEYGAEEVTLTGEVLNLKKLEDFPGGYGAIGGGVTLGDLGVGAVTLSNDNCVYINAKADAEGLRLSAPAPGGALISFVE